MIPPTSLHAAPTNHCWQALLASLFPPPAGSAVAPAALLRLAQRVAADQLLYAPLNNAATILFVALVADRRSWPAARSKLVAELPGVQRRGWRLWPLVQLFNQSLVPLEVRGQMGRCAGHWLGCSVAGMAGGVLWV